MRYAIYYTPGEDETLARAAAGWLGRNTFTGETTPPVAVPPLSAAEVAFHTASARRYGFHATLKAPFRLADGETVERLEQAIAAFAAASDPVPLHRLDPATIDGFLALVPETMPDLQRLAGSVVETFERFRAPLSEAEIARRNPEALDAEEFRYLQRWGYPYVFDKFRFHMTLTGRAGATDMPRIRAAVDQVFGPALEKPAAVDALALFVEPEPGAPFLVKSWHAIGHAQDRKTA